MAKEHRVQTDGRNALAIPGVFCTRANVGKGWTGDITKLPDGSILIRNPRPFDTGLPKGFADTFGVVCETITADMVGETIGRGFFVEYKAEDGSLKPIQAAFLEAMRQLGARAGVARSAQDAVDIALGRKS